MRNVLFSLFAVFAMCNLTFGQTLEDDVHTAHSVAGEAQNNALSYWMLSLDLQSETDWKMEEVQTLIDLLVDAGANVDEELMWYVDAGMDKVAGDNQHTVADGKYGWGDAHMCDADIAWADALVAMDDETEIDKLNEALVEYGNATEDFNAADVDYDKACAKYYSALELLNNLLIQCEDRLNNLF